MTSNVHTFNNTREDTSIISSLIKFNELKAFDTEFIKKYQSLPELWNSKHDDYTNKYRRHAALEELLKIIKKYDEEATLDQARKKINTLRSNYRKMLKRHLSSKHITSDGEESYTFVPGNWKFYALRFLGGESDFSVNNENELSTIEDDDDNVGSDDNESEDNMFDSMHCDEDPINLHQPQTIHSPPQSETRKKIKRMKVESSGETEEINSMELKAIATNVTYKLRRMSGEQRCHAELLINKVLYHGLRNNLTSDTDLAEMEHPQND